MTIVAACHFKDGTVVVADSRVTWQSTHNQQHQDSLQKIVSLGPTTFISYAGSVDAAEVIIRQLRGRMSKRPKLKFLKKLSTEIPRIAKHYFSLHKYSPLSLILGGVNKSGNPEIWWYESPNFICNQLKDRFKIIGSGKPISPYLEANYSRFASNEFPDLKSRADIVRTGIESELNRIGITTVGGMLQEIIIDSQDISPMSYGFLDLNPKGKPRGKSMKMRVGQWIQEDLTDNSKIPLVEPANLNTNPINFRFQDYSPLKEVEVPEWYLSYFVLCGKASIEVGTITLEGVVTQMGFPEYPSTLRIWVAVGFWGPAGKRQLEFYFVTDTEQVKVYEETIQIEHIFEEVDFSDKIEFTIVRPGKAFLECKIDGNTIGRKALYFGQGKKNTARTENNGANPLITAQENLVESHRSCFDPLIESTNGAILEYFSICDKCIAKGMYLRFENQMKVLFYKSYPLRFRLFLATAFRMSKGEHDIQVDMVNAATRESSILAKAKAVASSSCIVTPVHGDLITTIPSSGIYFININVDGQLVGSALLPAEAEKPVWTYSLNPEDVESVKSGELIILPKRAINESKSLSLNQK